MSRDCQHGRQTGHCADCDVEELEHEHRLMRARNERLERELEATREHVHYWRDMHEKAVHMLLERVQMSANPPMRLACEKESFEAGRMTGANEAREEAAKLCEILGAEGCGTPAIAAAIRKGAKP